MRGKSLLLAYFIILLLSSMALTNRGWAPALPKLYVDPPNIVDVTKQAGTYFTVNITVADVTVESPLQAYWFKISWDAPLLNYTLFSKGPFLESGGSDSYWSVRKNQTGGYIHVAQWLLRDPETDEIFPVSGSGVLVTIEFLVEGYGSTTLDLYDTTLLTPGPPPSYDPVPMDHTVEDGYFRNKYPGDIDGDWDSDYDDFLAFAASYLKTSVDPGYDREADFDLDGDVDYDDFLAFAANYLKTFP